MNFAFTDEQQQLADALRRYLNKQYTFEARRAIVHSDAGVSAASWAAFAELGLTALPVPQAQGGFDGGAVDMLVVMQELGRALVVEPYWATAVGIEALRLAGNARGDDAVLLERAAQGEIRLAVAFHEPHARYDLFSVETTATQQGERYQLNGIKSVVQHGAQADHWIVPARLAGEIALFVVARDAAGAQVTDYRTIDGQRAATLTFGQTPARRLGGVDAGAATLERIADYGTVLLCAEAVGALDALNHATTEYVKTRQQFGVPIARFQVLQHRMVDMHDPCGTGSLADVSGRRPLCKRRRRRTPPRGIGGEGADRPGGALRRPASGAVARRHGRDRRSRRGASVQASCDHRNDFGRCRSSSCAVRCAAGLCHRRRVSAGRSTGRRKYGLELRRLRSRKNLRYR
jgi:hypothetical protein